MDLLLQALLKFFNLLEVLSGAFLQLVANVVLFSLQFPLGFQYLLELTFELVSVFGQRVDGVDIVLLFFLELSQLFTIEVELELVLVFQVLGICHSIDTFKHVVEFGLSKVVLDVRQSLVLFQLENLVLGDVVDSQCFSQFLAELLAVVLRNHDEVGKGLARTDDLFALDDGLVVQLPHLHDLTLLVFNCLLVEMVLLLQFVHFLLEAFFLIECFL